MPNPVPFDHSAAVADLVGRFRRNIAQYREPGYKEAQLRQEFLNPFFTLLGWDVENRGGAAEAYKEVIHEDSLKFGGGTKAPDYCFRIGGTRRFFVEAKKPSVSIATDGDAAFQLRRYAWSSKLPLSMLTNFETFSVYDCRFRPSRTDRASHSRVMIVGFEELTDRWAALDSLFSRRAVIQGDFDRYLQGQRRRGTAEVDDAFLLEIEQWREDLARNLALRNRHLTQPELNEAVQLTIDRIVFLRICEDRGIEPYGQLERLTEATNVYSALFEVFERADDRYNSGLFHFGAEKDRAEKPDTLTPRLAVDDRTLKDILKRLYYPESPYEFSVLPANILGHVYERFLGSVIRLTTGHQAKIERKPELRRKGGVYYTPSYVVRFIVQCTLGRLVHGRTLREVRGLRIVDPACGSGSFLIEAYQFLLDWYLGYYMVNQPQRHSESVDSDGRGGWKLTNSARKRILVDHIFGVDLDAQAVEVTKLSLLLKVLEGESERTIADQLRLFQERALPDLAVNIKCGDSLIGADFATGQQMSLVGDDATADVFDWPREFPGVFGGRRHGFDAVIGNPPYVYRNATQEGLREYYTRVFESAEGNFELYKFFLEKSVSLCQPNGYVGFIVSATFMVQPTFTKLRRLLAEHTSIVDLAPLGPNVFRDATVDTAIIVVQPKRPDRAAVLEVRAPSDPQALAQSEPYTVRQARFRENPGHVFDYRLTDPGAAIVNRMLAENQTLETGFEFGVGINTGYIREALVADRKRDSRYHRMVPGTGLSRYRPVRTEGWIMYDREFVRSHGERGRSLPAEHLLSSDKILVVRTRNLSLKTRIVATIDCTGAYNLNRLSNLVARPGYSLLGLLGVLNSTLYNWLYSTRFYDYEIKPVYLRSSPMPDVNDARLIRGVTLLIDAYSALEQASTENRRRACQRRIDVLEKATDARVYELFRLSPAEVRVVEQPIAGFASGEDADEPADDEQPVL